MHSLYALQIALLSCPRDHHEGIGLSPPRYRTQNRYRAREERWLSRGIKDDRDRGNTISIVHWVVPLCPEFRNCTVYAIQFFFLLNILIYNSHSKNLFSLPLSFRFSNFFMQTYRICPIFVEYPIALRKIILDIIYLLYRPLIFITQSCCIRENTCLICIRCMQRCRDAFVTVSQSSV